MKSLITPDKVRTILLAAGVLTLGGFLAGCEEGPLEEAGEDIDEAVEEIDEEV
jgi:hypothetical protein